MTSESRDMEANNAAAQPPAPKSGGKPNLGLWIGVAVLSIAVGVGTGLFISKRANTVPETSKGSTFSSSKEDPKTPEEIRLAELEAMMGRLADQYVGKPFTELSESDAAQMEQLSKPYPSATLELTESSIVFDPAGGSLIRLSYTTADTIDQVKDWYEADVHESYRTTTANKPGGLPGYTIAVSIEGLGARRDIHILGIPGEAPETNILVEITRGR